MEYTNLIETEKFKEDTTRLSMLSAYTRVLKIGKRFSKLKACESFTNTKRIKMLNQMIYYFEQHEEYEKCFILFEILKDFDTDK